MCQCVCAPVPGSPHMRRGTGVLGDVAGCPHTQKRPLGRKQTRQHAGLPVISAPCIYSPEPWAHKKSVYVNENTSLMHLNLFLLWKSPMAQCVYTDVIKFSVWTAAWARFWGGGAMESVWSFLMSRRSDIIWVCTASCLWTRSHYEVTETTHRCIQWSWQKHSTMFGRMYFCWPYGDCDVCWSLARLPSFSFTLQGHGDLLWLVPIK